MKLAHLSDLHLGGPNPRRQWRRVRALIDRALGEGVDHLLLGGDLVDTANLNDIKPLVNHLRSRRFLSAERLSVVPGNHDVWPFSESEIAGEALGALAADLGSRLTLRNWPAQQRYVRFTDLFTNTFTSATRLHDDDPYPCVKMIDGVAIAMLDTTSDRGYLHSAEGRFDPDEASFVIEELRQHVGPRLLLMHHVPWRVGPFDMSHVEDEIPWLVRKAIGALGLDLAEVGDPDFVDLRGVRRFIKQARFDAVLCGHVHMFTDSPRARAFRDHVGEVPVYCMGRSGAVHQDDDDAVYAYDVVTVSGRSLRVATRYVHGDDFD